jgi:diguanylate cyclase (GGDEF)-like protein
MPHAMNFRLSDGHDLALTGEGGQLSTALLIDNEIARYVADWRLNRRAAILRFTEAVEERFEDDTRGIRARELQLTMTLALGFYLVTALTDIVLVPDIGLTGLVMRTFGSLPILLTILFSSKLKGRSREVFVTFAAIFAVVLLATVPAISSAPLSPFAFATAFQGMIYCNTTIPLRFVYACVCSIACCAIIVFEVFAHPGISRELGAMLTFQVVIAASYSLITSYRVERSMRMNYLLSSREALRLQTLSADREVLTTLSNTDSLTGLVNRRHFDRESMSILSNPSNTEKQVALLFFDVDHFKRYNDHYGHPAGDGCLRAVASAVSAALRGTDSLTARYGGEEFAILLRDVNQAQAERIAERVCRAVSAQALPHMNRADGVKFVTISIGVACGTISERLTIDGLIEAADSALYTAKRAGRNQVAFGLLEAA